MNIAEFKKNLLQDKISSAQEWFFIISVSLLCMIVFISSDVFLPFLPEMTKYFNTSMSLSQMSLTAFIVGLSLGQIPHGLLSDRFGRKSILNLMIPMFLLATLGCIFSKNIEFFIICRFFQAISASACIVIGRSLFSDVFEPLKAQRAFAVLVPLVSLSPALAPSIGGALSIYFSWRSSFVFVFIFGLIISLFVFIFLPETKPIEKRTKNLSLLSILNNFYIMLTDLKLLYYILIVCFSTAVWWVYAAGAPLMFHKMEYSAAIIGLLYLPAVIPYFTTSLIARSLLKTKSVNYILNIGINGMMISCLLLFLLESFNVLNVWTLMISVTLVTGSNGFLLSTAMSAGILHFSKNSGLVSGLLGTLQLLAGAFSAALIGLFANVFDKHYYVNLTILFIVFGSVLSYVLKRKVIKHEAIKSF
jgi:DHA1 family bicyclomycin/chloramphenicol resistance-like MFS transporter